ncbi:NAD(P)-binding protein [Wilcoxina mikolae CBS 423.85]|nr:NAD(P)-binding protein [Wilcoxina mikolae CBS 423.85]
MVLLITGATGGLGRGILKNLESLGVPKDSYAGSTSSLARLPQDLKDSGISYREANFNSPTTLDTAFQGVTKLLIVSTDTLDVALRTQQQQNAIDAAKRQGVERIYYTSLAFGGFSDDSKMGLMAAHLATEAYLKTRECGFNEGVSGRSGVDYTIIREGVYTDAFPFFLNWFPTTTKVALPNDGEIAWTSRDELAEGTAKVLLEDRFRNETLLLTAQEKLNLRDTAAAVSNALGKEVSFEVVPKEEYVKALVRDGKPEWVAVIWAETYDGMAKGEGATVDPLLEELLGRKPIGAKEWIRKTLEKDPAYIWHQQVEMK